MSGEQAPDSGSRDEGAPEGVQALDHTADVGIRVEAQDLESLFRRVALGSLWLAVGEASSLPDAAQSKEATTRTVELEAEGLDALLRSWSREVLYWQEVEDFLVREIPELEITNRESRFRLRARVRGELSPVSPLREIKGVTWHGLEVHQRGSVWHAQVIYDV